MSQLSYTYRINLKSLNTDVSVEKWDSKNNDIGQPSGRFDYNKTRQKALERLTKKSFRGNITSDEIRELGEHLFNSVFDSELRNDFLNFYDQVVFKEQNLLRIELDINETQMPNVAALPWEFMRIPENNVTGDEVWLSSAPNIVLSRRRARWRAPDPIKLNEGEKLRIAVVVSTPNSKELGMVSYKKLYAELIELGQFLKDDIELVLVNPESEMTTRDTIDKVLEGRPHIFHFIGHGRLLDNGQEGIRQIALVHETGQAKWVNASQFSGLFVRHRPGLVMLQACESGKLSESQAFSGIASQIVQHNIPVVVAMQYEISNAIAHKFVSEFYRRLALGDPVDKAVQEGRYKISNYHETRDFAAPMIFMRLRDGQLFTNALSKTNSSTINSTELIVNPNSNLTHIVQNYQNQHIHPSDINTLPQRVDNYLVWLAERFGKIELRGIQLEGQQVLQLDLDAVYVPLEANVYVPGSQQRARYEGPEARSIHMSELLSIGHRVILTGGPGSGKSTVLLHIVRTLALSMGNNLPELARDRLGLQGELPLPIFIPLSAYAAHLRRMDQQTSGIPAENFTLSSFISFYLKQHQASFQLPEDFFEKLLGNGKSVILLLDGLDEVPNEAERVRVRQAIEDLVIGRDDMCVVVSCRTAAHKGRTALGREFREVRVKPLDDTHIAKLVQHAYDHIYEDDVALRDYKVNELLEAVYRLEIDRRNRLGNEAQRLIDSPLLLRLLFTIHYRNPKLPEKRAELYMMATDAMLLPDYGPDEEVTDAIGRIIGGKQQLHRDLLKYLAFKMHSQGNQQGREIDEYSLRQLLSTNSTYSPLADDFIVLTRLRGTLMEERLGQYRFIHLAFQEFLVARYIAETMCNEVGLPAVITFLEDGPVIDSWWREPILLLIGYLSIKSPTIAGSLLECLANLGNEVGDHASVSEEKQLAAVELAATALLEWPKVRGDIHNLVHERLNNFFSDDKRASIIPVRATVRASAGVALGHLGDNRSSAMNLDEMEFCLIPSGPFLMGSDINHEDNEPNRQESLELEKPQHQIDLSYNYWLARFPVTNAQFEAFVKGGGYRESNYWIEAKANGVWKQGEIRRWFWVGQDLRNSWDSVPFDYGAPTNLPNHPRVGICWYEGLAFMRWLTQRWIEKGWLSKHLTLCFPSEPEWEKASRGGIKLPGQAYIKAASRLGEVQPIQAMQDNPFPERNYPWGNNKDLDFHNVQDSGIGSINAVGCFPQNRSPYGCEEMSGNVWEWTRSLWGKQKAEDSGDKLKWDLLFEYPYNVTDGREDLMADGYWLRVPRGGAFITEGKFCRCSFRDYGSPSFRFPWDGFRIAIVPVSVLSKMATLTAERSFMIHSFLKSKGLKK